MVCLYIMCILNLGAFRGVQKLITGSTKVLYTCTLQVLLLGNFDVSDRFTLGLRTHNQFFVDHTSKITSISINC